MEMKDETEEPGETVSEAVINCDATLNSEGNQSRTSSSTTHLYLTIDHFQSPQQGNVVRGQKTQRQTFPNVKESDRVG